MTIIPKLPPIENLLAPINVFGLVSSTFERIKEWTMESPSPPTFPITWIQCEYE